MPSPMKKTPCPVTRSQFRALAKPMQLIIVDSAGKQHVQSLVVKEFSTGSLGWNVSAKVDVPCGSVDVHCQLGVNITIANSKELPKDDAVTPPVPPPAQPSEEAA